MINENDSSNFSTLNVPGKILVGTIGYHNLGNHSLGPALLPMLQTLSWPQNVEVEEMNWGPIAIVQKFQSLETPYHRVILLAAIERPGRNIGDIDVFRWMGRLPDDEMIQACVGDGVTGVISLELTDRQGESDIYFSKFAKLFLNNQTRLRNIILLNKSSFQ